MERFVAIALGLFGHRGEYAKIGNAKNARRYLQYPRISMEIDSNRISHNIHMIISFVHFLLLFDAGELENFLCIVQHDRKFFLTETANVLKQSIMKTEDFTAYKALIGFEAISLYASNLFRKPWRKEYRCIKVNWII